MFRSAVKSRVASFGLTNAWLQRAIFVFIVVLFCLTNVPWTLDDYDQAKQAYTSFEMVRQGHWLYQHTPNEGIATKPPLVGWISAGIFYVTRWWDGAWRLPSFGAALALLWFVRREATLAFGTRAGFLAACAVGLNLLAPRLATLVRTDMPLALVIFLLGWQIWRKMLHGEKWEARDRVLAFALLTASMLIKGPIVYAFILPGLVVYQFLRCEEDWPSAWCGWWPWIFSLATFFVWVAGGIVRQPGFYEIVVVKEFAGRFSETIHRPQPLYFYLPHLLHKFAPWSLLLIALAIVFWRKRSELRMKPATLWLVCWSLGGLIVMSVIPSKRVDRIFPVVPPFCLLLGAQLAAVEKIDQLQKKLRPWLIATLIFACVFTGGYAILKIGTAEKARADALVKFAGEVRRDAAQNSWRYELVGGHDEGLLLYLCRDHFLAPNDARARWNSRQFDALIVPLTPPFSLPGAKVARISGKSASVGQYQLLVRGP